MSEKFHLTTHIRVIEPYLNLQRLTYNGLHGVKKYGYRLNVFFPILFL